MKIIIRTVLAGMFLFGMGACDGNEHFLTDREYREKVHENFLERMEFAAGRSEALFSVFGSGKLTTKQREALEFLYAYMPLCDLSEYNGEYFLRQVDGAFRAREYFPWSKTVPEDIFRHFVLVHRVSNEYMDDARDVFFDELKDRVKDMSMYDAALEVNHWCHEKVTYRATDARTSAPLALMKTSWGRCGEESVFTTTALRAVGIPARQCYTPRWVHTDSNHAWVEVWVDGKWHYLGACEPEPELDVAWFDGPVQRAMMTHTTVYGLYNGPEEKNIETPLYSVINTLANYAQTRRMDVRVLDMYGDPVGDATVKFKVYNSAQLYPIVTMQSDDEGRAAINTGMGDLMIWASKGDNYGYAERGPEATEATVMLNYRPGEHYSTSFTMKAPPEKPFSELPEEKIAANAVRLAYEDSLRNAYMATFPDEVYAQKVAGETGLDGAQVWRYLDASQGNWCDIEKFIRDHGRQALKMLATLRDKDLRDTPADVLETYMGRPDDDNFWRWTASPRIGYELITPFKEFFPGEKSPQKMIEAAGRIKISDADNYYNCRQTPSGVHEMQVADRSSRDIYFVALCRSAGIQARLDPATGTPQYNSGDGWINVDFDSEDATSIVPSRGRLVLQNAPGNIVTPGYESHFTVAVYRDGDFRTLGLGNHFGEAWAKGQPVEITLEEGYYRLMVASRANDGSATFYTQYFNIAKDSAYTAEIKLPEVEGKLFVQGIVDMNSIVTTDTGEKTTLKKLARGKGVVLCFADPDKEPTKHILQELPAYRQALEDWGGAVVFMVPGDKRTEAFDPARFGGQPSQTVWGMDTGRDLLNQTAGALQIEFRNNFPLVVALTNNGGIIFSSEGYRLGIPEEIMKTIRLEEQSCR